MNILLALACLFAMSLFVIGIVLRDWLRSKQLERQARLLGFSFQEMSRPLAGAHLQAAPFLVDGPGTIAFNVLTGSSGDLEVCVFDLYDHGTEAPLSSTVAAFHSREGGLPSFEVSRRWPLGRACESAKGPRLVFERESLGRRFSVRCVSDARQVNGFLMRMGLERLDSAIEQYRVACCPEWVFVFRPGKKVKPAEIARFITETSTVAKALLAEAGGGGLAVSSGASG
jgi:hypothetical protein